jgi:hypothetical protein
MSASMNGRAFWDGHSDSLAERCGRLIDNGVRKLGIKDLRSLRVNPTKLKDVFWAKNGSTNGRAGRRLDRYPDVRGMRVADIATKYGLTTSVAGRLLALQSMQAGGAK